MQISKLEQSERNTNSAASKAVCCCCGGQGHLASTCKFRNTKCRFCQELDHVARVCRARQKAERANKSSKLGKASSKLQKLENEDLDEEVDEYYVESSGKGHMNICQLSNPTHKFLVYVKINGVGIAMEVELNIPPFPAQNKFAAGMQFSFYHSNPEAIQLDPLSGKGRVSL